jgi:hypothetical protein
MGVVLGKGKSAKSNFICRDLVLEEIQFVGCYLQICRVAGIPHGPCCRCGSDQHGSNQFRTSHDKILKDLGRRCAILKIWDQSEGT